MSKIFTLNGAVFSWHATNNQCLLNESSNDPVSSNPNLFEWFNHHPLPVKKASYTPVAFYKNYLEKCCSVPGLPSEKMPAAAEFIGYEFENSNTIIGLNVFFLHFTRRNLVPSTEI
jgi:hypothetical protein